VASDVSNTNLSKGVPASVLKRLPEWCIYLDLSNVERPEGFADVHGAWVYLYHEVDTLADELHVAMDRDLPSIPFIYPLTGVSLMEMIDACLSYIRDEVHILSGYGVMGEGSYMSKTYEVQTGTGDSHRIMLSKIINLLLYICSSEPDIEDREEPDAKPSRARMQRMGKRDMFVAADRVRVWNVGDKVGEMIRNFNEEPKDRKHTRRHLRRAHWHGYWTGRRDSDEREFSYKWLSPMVVGVSA